MAKFDDLETRRPHCPECGMRMMPTKPGANMFSRARCGKLPLTTRSAHRLTGKASDPRIATVA
jgi:hypothetical protein